MKNSFIHKGLLPFRGKAIISHIIEQQPGAEFFFAVHHLADQLRQFMQHAYPDVSTTFVDVGSIDSPSAGPGFSLLKALEVAGGPALVVTSDTYFTLPHLTPWDRNWLGLGSVPAAEQLAFCNIKVGPDARVLDVLDKRHAGPDYLAWTGLMYVHDWLQVVWNLEQAVASPAGGEVQCSAGWADLDWFGVEHEWLDFGTKERFDSIVNRDGFDYSKPDEQTYLLPDRVIKFFADPARARLRHERQSGDLKDVTPRELLVTDNFISYEWAQGETFYRRGTPHLFAELLRWVTERLWVTNLQSDATLGESAKKFYREKTLNRVSAYLAQSERDFSTVNGVTLAYSWPELLELMDWDAFCADTIASPFHGDFQFDNIIVDDNGGFKLIDWRDDFQGNLRGDLYYELAKLLSGLTFDFDLVRLNTFSVTERHGSATVTFARRTNADEYVELLAAFTATAGLNFQKVDALRWLILAGMSGVHKEPYSTALYFYSLAGALTLMSKSNVFFTSKNAPILQKTI